jgi:hypothetical protein
MLRSELNQLRRDWLTAAQNYYLTTGEQPTMTDERWDNVSKILMSKKSMFKKCPVLNNPNYDGQSLYWVKSEVYKQSLEVYKCEKDTVK